MAPLRLSIWIWTLALSAAYVALITMTWLGWVRSVVANATIGLAVAVAIVQTLMIAAILGGISLRRAFAARRAARSAVIRHAVDAIVAEAASGGDPLARARSLYQIRPRETLEHLASAAGAVRGEVRERIEWTIQGLGATLPAEERRIDLAAVAKTPLLERALAAEASRADAIQLAEEEIPRALASSDPAVALAALELLASWRRLLAVRGAIELIAHPDPRLREAACRAAPYVIPPEGIERVTAAIGSALDDPDAAVREAAARAAGALAIDELAPTLGILIGDPNPDVSLAAAFALALLPAGVPILTSRSTGSARTAAAHAFEALEKRSLGRLETL